GVTREQADQVKARMGGIGARTPIVFTTSWQQYYLARNGPGNTSQQSESPNVGTAEELPFHDFDADEEDEDGSEGSEYEHSFHGFDADEQSEEESDVDVTIIIIRKTTSRQ
ncbi:hypothetical protein KCU73_g12736, partial [Aureobasidium melanogenum]